MSFGETLQHLREKRDISQHRLGLLAQVPPSNINRIEKGARGVPEPRTLLAIAEALNLSQEERRDLIEAALGQVVKEKTEQYAVYLYLFLASDKEMTRRADALQSEANADRGVRDFMASRGEKVGEHTIRDLFIKLADDADYEDGRRDFARLLIERLIVDLGMGEVSLRLGPLATGLLEENSRDVPAE